jgi:hypothetical protein
MMGSSLGTDAGSPNRTAIICLYTPPRPPDRFHGLGIAIRNENESHAVVGLSDLWHPPRFARSWGSNPPLGWIIPGGDFQEAMSHVRVAKGVDRAHDGARRRRWALLARHGIPFQHVDVSCADMHDGTLEALLADAFGTAGVPLKQVVIEGTETVYMGDGGRSVPKGGRGTARHSASSGWTISERASRR